jgi:preprotein translocase subunit SecD
VAPPPGTLRVGRYFLALLGLLAVLYSLIVFPGERHTPKLGIDLVGGLRVVFTAISPKGSPPPSSSQMGQARQILEDRINTTGVTGATVVVQGSDQLVVEIPNGTGADVNKLGKAAILNFRGLAAPVQQRACLGSSPIGGYEFVIPVKGTVTVPAVQSAFTAAKATLARAPREVHKGKTHVITADVRNTATATVSSTQQQSITAAVAKSLGLKKADVSSVALCTADPFAVLVKTDPALKNKIPNAESCPSPGLTGKPCVAFSSLGQTQQTELLAALRTFDCGAAETEPDLADRYYIACDKSNSLVYLLGHIIVHGKQISSAQSVAPDTTGNGNGNTDWVVNLKLGNSGADAWHAWTSKYHTSQNSGLPIQTSTTAPCGASAALPCSDWVAFTLDGQVLSAPITNGVLDINTQISGGFTQSSADELARELNYGKLPLSFRPEGVKPVSATLGNKQLHAAFLAGGIGLALVVIYSFLYYRGLGLVTISSLLVSGALTYAMLVVLSKQIGYTLDLAGIAGFIVALGITADSFVVFFERIKDEVHEGRSVRVAVPRAWVRARRTILSADSVSFLAAAILYFFASADVKGFAFTLGMSTILDLVVVFLFTHPMVSLLSRLRAFDSARFTGLGSVRVGGIAIADDEPPPQRPRRVRRTPARADAGAEPSAVAVLDGHDEAEPADAPAAEPASEPAAGPAPEPQDEPATAQAEQPRRHSTPAPGTAAERAAARRARLREQAEGRGKQ